MKRLAALVVVLALAAAGCGADEAEDAAATQPVTVTETVAATQPEAKPVETAPPEPTPEPPCSTAGVRLTLPEQELPEPVAATRRQLFDAAVACDYSALAALASEEGFTFSYGGDTSAAEFWRAREEAGPEEPGPRPMRALATILALPFTRNESGSYAWPTAYSEAPADEAWQALVDAGLYSEEQVGLMRTQGSGYLGYRTAITPEGDWQFFVAGD